MTSAAWAAANARVRDCPVISAMHSDAAIAPDALMPNPWLTGRSFSMRISSPIPGARSSAAFLVTCAMDWRPSNQMLTALSSLGSTVALEPRFRRIPTPRDPEHMTS